MPWPYYSEAVHLELILNHLEWFIFDYLKAGICTNHKDSQLHGKSIVFTLRVLFILFI